MTFAYAMSLDEIEAVDVSVGTGSGRATVSGLRMAVCKDCHPARLVRIAPRSSSAPRLQCAFRIAQQRAAPISAVSFTSAPASSESYDSRLPRVRERAQKIRWADLHRRLARRAV